VRSNRSTVRDSCVTLGKLFSLSVVRENMTRSGKAARQSVWHTLVCSPGCLSLSCVNTVPP
jgi:hypothetical protein